VTASGVVTTINATNSSTSVPIDPFLSADGTDLYFSRNNDGEYSLAYASRGDTTQAFGAPKTLFSDARNPVLSADRLTLYYTVAQKHIYRAKRSSVATPFAAGTFVAELEADVDAGGASLAQSPASVSPDGCTLYFLSNRVGKAFRAYRVRRGQ
jgi:Tol biopolymer transport system component